MQEVKIFGINFLYSIDNVIDKVDIRFEYRNEGTYLGGNIMVTKAEYDENEAINLLQQLVITKIQAI
jgi:hypothetical protein